jgi:hypothetical protein
MPNTKTAAFPLSGPINLSARLGHGSLTVLAVDDLTEASVELTPRDGAEDYVDRITVEMAGPTLTVHAPRQGGVFDLFADRVRGQSAVDVVVRVPSDTAIKIATFTAGIVVRGRCGGADIASGSARIELDDVNGDLRLRYGHSSSSAKRVSGSVTVRSGAGNARFGEILGSLQSGFGSGRLEVDSVHGAVRSRTGAGEARLGAVYGDVDLASGSGAMSIGLPAGVTARLEVHTGSGRVRSDLPIEDEPKAAKGAITVRARTGSGDVRLFRAA